MVIFTSRTGRLWSAANRKSQLLHADAGPTDSVEFFFLIIVDG